MMISNYTMCASVHVRSAEPEEDHLQTPNCSNTGYEDEEDHHGDDHPGDEAEEEDTAGHGDDGDPGSEGGRGRGWDEEGGAPAHSVHNIHGVHQHQVHHDAKHPLLQDSKHPLLLSPGALNCEDIDADNLAADFDGSFTGLGVDINTANYSMSEAMMSINHIATGVKEEAGLRVVTSLKSEPPLLFSNYGALDLSNDDAQHPDSEQSQSPQNRNPPTFSGSVSRENSQVGRILLI